MASKEKVLIFQIGSLGDTVIAMPCYREIARRHPNAERNLLTNTAVGSKMVQAEALLRPAGLVHGTVEYPMPLRGWQNILALYRKLRALKIDVLYYLMPEKRFINVVRHYAFLKLCGVRRVRAMPWSRDLRRSREIVPGTLWETEGSRLLRTLVQNRSPGAPDPADRTLDLTAAERAKAETLITEMGPVDRFIAFSIGGRIPIKDWGDENWSIVLQQLSAAEPNLGIVFVGSKDEWERNDYLASFWTGPKLNSCGRLAPRETAAVIECAAMFLGHDTGTMHLAAAVDTRTLGLFCARDVPGIWFTDRPADHFFYHQPPCFGCQVTQVAECKNELVCMTSHRHEEIVQVALATLTGTKAEATLVEQIEFAGPKKVLAR